MTDLSPAAAVMIAYWKGQEASQQLGVAAALEAVADQLVPEEQEPVPNEDSALEMRMWAVVSQRQRTRSRLLAIAAELRAQ